MKTNIFERIEKKYVLTEDLFDAIMKNISEYCIPDAYPVSDICSIYYDNSSNSMVCTSNEKPIYKEKLRMRSYGVPEPDSRVYVEVKKKFNGVVYKRRVHMKYKNAVNYLEKGAAPPKPSQITREIDYLIKFYGGVKPAMFVYYHRLSFVGKNNESLRITFDENVLCRDYDLSLDKGIYGEKLVQDGIRLMEIKTVGAMPLWLAHALDTCKIFPGSFSKYGTAYLKGLEEKKQFTGDI